MYSPKITCRKRVALSTMNSESSWKSFRLTLASSALLMADTLHVVAEWVTIRNVSSRPLFKNYPIAAKSVIEDEAANEGNAAKG